MIERVLLRPWAALILPLAAFVLAMLLWASLALPTLQSLLSEDGIIEQPTQWLFFLAGAFALLWRRPEAAWSDSIALALVMFAFGAREMDLHKSLTEGSVLRVSFYFGSAPLMQKLVALSVVALAAWAMAWLLLRHTGRIVAGVRRADPACISVAVFVVALVGIKMLDRSVGVLTEDFGMSISSELAALVVAIEEVDELVLPIIALLAMWQHRRQRGDFKSATDPPPT
jgi:hypothetical protein